LEIRVQRPVEIEQLMTHRFYFLQKIRGSENSKVKQWHLKATVKITDKTVWMGKAGKLQREVK